nr:Chain P, B6 Peptide [synthetic construct]
AQFSASASR